MTRITIDYELSDAAATQAVREDCLAFVREHFSAKDALLVLGSTAVFAAALVRDGHWLWWLWWLWWLAGLPIIIFSLLGLVWLFFLLWLPNAAIAKRKHLPNRRVRVEASAERLAFRTATELLDVAWSEQKALKRRPTFWIFCLKSGARIPVPAQLVSQQDAAFFAARLEAPAQLGR